MPLDSASSDQVVLIVQSSTSVLAVEAKHSKKHWILTEARKASDEVVKGILFAGKIRSTLQRHCQFIRAEGNWTAELGTNNL